MLQKLKIIFLSASLIALSAYLMARQVNIGLHPKIDQDAAFFEELDSLPEIDQINSGEFRPWLLPGH